MLSPARTSTVRVLVMPNSGFTSRISCRPAGTSTPSCGVLPSKRPSTYTWDQGRLLMRSVPGPEVIAAGGADCSAPTAASSLLVLLFEYPQLRLGGALWAALGCGGAASAAGSSSAAGGGVACVLSIGTIAAGFCTGALLSRISRPNNTAANNPIIAAMDSIHALA